MKRFWGTLLLAVIVTLLIQGCIGLRTVRGTGDMTTEDREVSSFTALELATIGNVEIELGNEESLRVEAEDNLIQHIETEVRDNTLRIKNRRNVTILPTQAIFYYVTVKDLDSISVSGLGNVNTPDLQADNFSINISGGGDIEIEALEAERLSVEISGLGDLTIADGEVGLQEVVISGGGNHQTRDMASDEAEVNISGLGSATLWVRNHLDVVISGGGSVRYIGNPDVDQNVSGLGRVERIDE